MSRLHLVTSRAPISGAIAAGDHLVFLEAELACSLKGQLFNENPQLKADAVHALCEESAILQELQAISYEGLVALCEACQSVVSW